MAIPVAYARSMRRPLTSGKRWLAGLALALALAACAPAAARELVLRADTVRTGAATLEQVEVRLAWPEGAATGELRLDAGRLSAPLLGYDVRGLAWICPLTRAAAGEWRCDGGLAQAGRRRGRLTLAVSPAALDAVLALGPRRVAVGTRAVAPGQVRLELARLPVAWLQAFLSRQWPEGQWTAGEAGGRLDLDLSQPERLAARGRLALTGLGLETPTGWLAAAGVDASLNFAFESAPSDTRVQATLTTQGGEFLAQSFYARLPATPVRIEVEARRPGGGGWRLSRLAWLDPGVLEAEGSAALASDASLRELDLQLRLGELALARDRYLSGVLAPAGFPDLVLSGGAEVTLQVAGGAARSLDARLRDVNAVDPRQRFILSGVGGDLRWRAGDEAMDSALGWRSAALFGIGLGPVRFDLRSAGGELALRAPAAMDVLGGRVALEHLRWWPPDEEANARFALGVRLDDLDLGSLSQRLGWPPFTGKLGGRIPSARYARGVLTLDGGLAMQAFGGTVALSDLVMERPFGIAPTLSADVAIDDVDLEPMTAAFGFGSITGRLDGRIAGLRMVDWSPVAFDARLRSDPAWRGRRRISQRAVEDISRVGGAGLMAGLQAQALRLFDDFGYKRLGLACRLRDNVCRMDGVDSAGDGYTIVEGAGLPRIQVVGFRRRVDWPTLVARLKAVTEGQVPVVQ